MKLLISIFAVLIILVFAGCSSIDTKTDVICISSDKGDRKYNTFIGTDNKSIDSSYQHERYLKESIEEFYGSSRYIVKPDILKYLSKYINDNCAIKNKESRKALAMYTIRSYSKNGVQKCYFYEKQEIIKYFGGMITWINESPYKTDCSSLIEQLQLFIKTLKS